MEEADNDRFEASMNVIATEEKRLHALQQAKTDVREKRAIASANVAHVTRKLEKEISGQEAINSHLQQRFEKRMRDKEEHLRQQHQKKEEHLHQQHQKQVHRWEKKVEKK